MAVIRARTEASHKAKRADRTTYETVRRDTTQFVLDVAADTWVQELRDTETIYLLSHLQAGCTGRHALDLLALHNEMQRYHLEVEGIPKYINILEDAQRQAGRVGQTIANKTLLLFATIEMLTTETFPRAGDDWEERTELDKTWFRWNQAYKKFHAKARIKSQANEGTVKFGAANSAAHQETELTVENKQVVDNGKMKALEGYFDNLAATAVNEKSVL